MRKLLGNLDRVLIGLFFAAALVFALSQVVAATQGPPCHTPPGTCGNHESCNDACDVYNGTFSGGQCQSDDHCCVCFE